MNDSDDFNLGVGVGTVLGLVAGWLIATVYHSAIITKIEDEGIRTRTQIKNMEDKMDTKQST